jgi:hypothetical protein
MTPGDRETPVVRRGCNWCSDTGELGPPHDKYMCPCPAGELKALREAHARLHARLTADNGQLLERLDLMKSRHNTRAEAAEARVQALERNNDSAIQALGEMTGFRNTAAAELAEALLKVATLEREVARLKESVPK